MKVSLLGQIVFSKNDTPVTQFRSQKEIALLAYLAHTGQAHSREAVADLLWEASSTKQSLSNLRTILARIRKKVGDVLVVTRKTVGIAPAVHEWVDSVRFQSLLGDDGEGLRQGMELYAGDFMPAFYLPDAPRFNDWVVVEQERLRQIATIGFRQLTKWQEEQHAFDKGVLTAQRWVEMNPFDEVAQQQLMRLLAFAGRESEAVAVYEKCRHLLQTELAIAPASATTTLIETIQQGKLKPPVALSPLPHNLPRTLTPLFGRHQESETIKSYLVNPNYPLVSITGVGGMGKTSLAMAVGRQLLAENHHPFNDGIWFIAMADIENSSVDKVKIQFASLVGQAMGLNFHGENDLWTQLLGQLASKNILLILDNIEQFLTIASDLILALLATGSGIKLLVTTRLSLALAANVTVQLSGLDIPTEVSAEALQNESVQLFTERAGRTPRPFNLDKNLREVVAICQFVQGMPLAIELAAASLGRLLVEEIMPALNSNLHLLDNSRPDLPARQRTFQAVFDTSWELLDAREQTVLAHISVFRGGFTRQAATAVLEQGTTGLYHLQHHALLHQNESGRFTIHPLLRQMAREKAIHFNLGTVANRHATYYTDFVALFADDLAQKEGKEALAAILPEQANIRVAWEHAVQEQAWHTIAHCLQGYHHFYKRKGLFQEEAALLDMAISAVEAKAFPNLLSQLLAKRAWCYLFSSELEAGVTVAERAIQLAENAGIQADATFILAKILFRQSKHPQALANFEQVVTLAKTANNPILEADGLIGIGGQVVWQADVRPAKEPLLKALHLCQSLGYKSGEQETLTWLGIMSMRQEQFADCVNYYQQALTISRQLGETATEAELLGNLGVVLRYQDDLVSSQASQEASLALFRKLNMPGSEQWLLGELGFTATLLGNYEKAAQNLNEALKIANEIKDVFWGTWVKGRLGTLWNEKGEWDKALAWLIDANDVAEKLDNSRLQAMILLDWGYALLGQENWAGAMEKFQKGYDIWQAFGQTQQAMPCLAGLAYVAWKREMPAIANAHAEELWQCWQASPKLAQRANLKVYWMLREVWHGLGDERAEQVWAKARTLLKTRGEKIADKSLQRMFLQKMPAHRAIMGVNLS